MWAAAAASTMPLSGRCPSNNIFSTKPPPHSCIAVAVSAKFQRRGSRPRKDDEDDDYSTQDQDIGGLGHAVVTALNSNSLPNTVNAKTTTTTQPKQQRRQSGDKQRQLSGSDVLRALQKAATAQKNMKRKSRNNSSSSTSSTLSSEIGDPRRNSSTEGEYDYSKVKPLSIKSEWSGRLDELERRLQELLLDS